VQPLVSVLIPCYNVSEFVEKAIQSILVQTYTNLEILIIDDASTDDTLSKIKNFSDNRIRVIEFKENTKKIGAVNTVLRDAKGDIICFQDADDWSEPTRIELQVSEFKKNAQLGICFTNHCYVNNKIKIPNRIALNNDELRDEFLLFGYKKNKNLDATICGTMMITRNVLEKTNGYNSYFVGRVGEDIHWIYRILKNFEGVTVNEVLYNYKVREGSLTQIQFAGQNAKAAYSWKLISKIIYKDVFENINMLEPQNLEELNKLELNACEEALIESIQLNNETKNMFMKSSSFRLGYFLLTPYRYLTGKKV
jgi:glycosyltransferase involved in cell wall biosynthesis